jgi:hypothetical protein
MISRVRAEGWDVKNSSWLGRVMRTAIAVAVLAGGFALAVPGSAGASDAGRVASGQTVGRAGPSLPHGGATARQPTGQSHDFRSFKASNYLSCKGPADITGKFSLNITGVTGKLKKWAAPTKGKPENFTASLGLTTTISATVRVHTDTMCTPGTALKSLQTKFVIDGITVTVEPDFYLEITAGGTVTAAQSVTQTVTLTGTLGVGVPKASYTMTRGKPAVHASGTADFTAVIGGEANIKAGVLYLDFALMGGVEASATWESGQVCLTGYPAVRAEVTVGASILGWKPKKELLPPTTWEVKSIAGHRTEFTFGTCHPPTIVTATLPAAAVGEKYSASLATKDNREGAWKIASGSLPPGLKLSGAVIAGIPAARGSDAFKVKFTDTHGKTATAALAITVTTVPVWTVTRAQGGDVAPGAVSCPTAGFCAAIGSDQGPGNTVWFKRNGTWTTAQKIPLPADAAAPPGGSGPWVDLAGISCASASLCMVVGSYFSHTSGVDTVPLVMAWNGSSWKQDQLLHSDRGDTDLWGVSCPTTSYCVAVGAGTNNGTSTQTGLVANWAGSEWTVGDAQVPAASVLNHVSCASASSCTAIGTVSVSSNAEDVLLLTYSGIGWTSLESPLPSSGWAANGISCPSASFCVAVGWLDNTSVLTVVNGKPEDKPVPDVPLLAGVSCSSASSCVAVGSENNTANPHDGLFLTLANGKWTVSEAPGPAGAVAVGGLGSVSCAPAGTCAATGTYESTFGTFNGMLLTASS